MVWDSIKTYLNQVDRIYLIDNSDPVTIESLIRKIQAIKNIIYVCNQANYGIAAALNIGVQKAINDDFKYLLTMDQDSFAASGMVGKLVRCSEADETIGIAAPYHQIHFKSDSNIDNCIDEIVVMTSGNILNLSAYKKTGRFNEELFIDYVDHDYCLRLKDNNYRIVRVRDAILYHSVGKTVEKKIGFRKVYPANHIPVRLYYQTRNRFYLRNIYKHKYPSIFKEDLKLFRNSLIKIFLFEKEKLKKLKMVIRGYIDYRKNRLGKFKER
jgi:rhamnosyltransferase